MLKLHPKRRWLFTYHKTNQNCVDTLVQNQWQIHGRSTDAPQRAGSETCLTSVGCHSLCYVARPRCCLWNSTKSNIWYANLLIYRQTNKLLKWTFYKIIQTNYCFSLRLSCNLKKTCFTGGSVKLSKSMSLSTACLFFLCWPFAAFVGLNWSNFPVISGTLITWHNSAIGVGMHDPSWHWHRLLDAVVVVLLASKPFNKEEDAL